MSWRAPMSRPLFSMRRMISPMSLRRTPSPFTSTKVSSKTHLLLPADLLAATLVGAAVRAGVPLHVDRSLAVDAGLLELPVAHRADQVVPLDEVAAARAKEDVVPELPLEHRQLQLALARLFQVLRGTNYQVDERPQVRKDDSHDAPEQARRPAPCCVGVGPVDERDPHDDEEQQHELGRDAQERALQEVRYDLERVCILLRKQCQGAHRMNLIIMKYPRTKEATAIARRRPTSFQTPLFFTQPPEDGRAGVQGAGNQHHTAYFPRLLDRRLEGVHDVGHHPGPPPFAVSWTVLAHEVRGVRRPFVLGACKHEDVGLFSQLGKHTSDVFVSQDPEDHPQGPLSVSTPYPFERR